MNTDKVINNENMDLVIEIEELEAKLAPQSEAAFLD